MQSSILSIISQDSSNQIILGSNQPYKYALTNAPYCHSFIFQRLYSLKATHWHCCRELYTHAGDGWVDRQQSFDKKKILSYHTECIVPKNEIAYTDSKISVLLSSTTIFQCNSKTSMFYCSNQNRQNFFFSYF